MSAPHRTDADMALDWAIRMAEPEADWDAFTAWLEADPGNAERYDRAVVALEGATRVVADRPAPPYPTNVVQDVAALPGRAHRRGWFGGAIAAALAVAVGLGVWQQRDQSYVVATAAGEQRTVSLADGSRIALAGGSQVRLDKGHPRQATLVAGEALFQIRHDAGDPFSVRVRDLELRDIGTVFDVRMLGTRTHVAVAEGAVMVDPKGAAIRLDPGQSIVADADTLQRGEQDVGEIGTWREGRLAYDNARLSEVAEDLSRQLGLPITAAPAVATMTFNGTLETRTIRGDPALLGELLGVRVRPNGGGWTLDARR